MTGYMEVGYDGMNRFNEELLKSVRIAPLLVWIVIGVAFRSDRIARVAGDQRHDASGGSSPTSRHGILQPRTASGSHSQDAPARSIGSVVQP